VPVARDIARKLAKIPAGSWTKWLVVGFWVAVVAVAYPLSGKLAGAEKNDTSELSQERASALTRV
jgi:RND superfamily putative drug exporter